MERPLSQLALSAAKWPPAAALISLLSLIALFPEKYGLLPGWVKWPIWFVVLVLILLSTFAHISPLLRRLEGPLTFWLLALLTTLVAFDVAHLVGLVVSGNKELHGLNLLSTASALWLSNLVIFSLWYWLLDRGGPDLRLRGFPVPPDLQFPTHPDKWTPGFVDYVFVAFNTSMAFSPTDTAPVSARAKGMMMLQSFLSLVTLVIAAARAVNILE
jgi:hypothetical protein